MIADGPWEEAEPVAVEDALAGMELKVEGFEFEEVGCGWEAGVSCKRRFACRA